MRGHSTEPPRARRRIRRTGEIPWRREGDCATLVSRFRRVRCGALAGGPSREESTVPKTLPVRYVLTEPVTPTWWKKNRQWVMLIVGLVVGPWLVGGQHDASEPAQPRPTHSAAADGSSAR